MNIFQCFLYTDASLAEPFFYINAIIQNRQCCIQYGVRDVIPFTSHVLSRQLIRSTQRWSDSELFISIKNK